MLMNAPSDLARPLEPAALPARRIRDPRLDFFRGLGMFIILIAHVPGNSWTLWIPARFGFSDATEMFVFQSGMASALAYGATFDRAGAAMLVGRVARRIWQIYWTHVCVFVAILALLAAAGTRPDGTIYLDALNLGPFLADPGRLAGGLLTLTYVPNYFDILPMYLVILTLVPPMLLLARIHIGLAFALMAGLWLAAGHGLALPAEPFSDRRWFFNPFGWQLLFFTGFFLARGRIPAPRFRPAIAWAAGIFLAASVPFALVRWYEAHPLFAEAARALAPLTDKTDFGPLRYAHFLALAYLAAHAVGPGGAALRGPVVRVVSVVGQQSLAVFAAGMVTAQALGIWLGGATGAGAMAAANLAGFAVLIAVAYATRWFRSEPWRHATSGARAGR
ncbi:OpgC family protein [Amaricoccus solimangrovi]|uniref:OpgC domain-containing protein n=1 Tax=Amaricoccus solimangrovi TaxID=2589815 RepID=A0A501WJ80_9RHOB|nr:OpgC domain-containing protein [Amaricoccus solimangrovi]TPE48184.1 OpgC domain-containing protein [Amaricoccus solimangrovi]